jgi:hypothetical protein
VITKWGSLGEGDGQFDGQNDVTFIMEEFLLLTTPIIESKYLIHMVNS